MEGAWQHGTMPLMFSIHYDHYRRFVLVLCLTFSVCAVPCATAEESVADQGREIVPQQNRGCFRVAEWPIKPQHECRLQLPKHVASFCELRLELSAPLPSLRWLSLSIDPRARVPAVRTTGGGGLRFRIPMNPIVPYARKDDDIRETLRFLS